MTVSNRQHLNDGRKFSINNRKRESLQKKFSRSVATAGPAFRSLANAGDRAAQFSRESCGSAGASLQIPVESSFEFFTRCLVKFNFLICHEGAWTRPACELLATKPSSLFRCPAPQCDGRFPAPRRSPPPHRWWDRGCRSTSMPNPRALPRTGLTPFASARWFGHSFRDYISAPCSFSVYACAIRERALW